MSGDRLRVLVLTPDFPPAHGGIQLLAHRLVTHFDGIAARVVTLEPPAGIRWGGDGHLDVRRVSAAPGRRSGIARLSTTAFAEARRFRPEVVLAMHIVVAPAGLAIRRALGVPLITYLHAKEVTRRGRLASYVLRRSDRIVAVSRHTAALAIAAGADERRIHIIPPGVDWREPPTVERLATPTVVTVARLEDPHKGHDVMARAMPLVCSRVRGAQWVVVGEGALRKDIERLSDALGVRDAIRLCGALSDDERDEWLSRAHVFAMPSRVPAGGGGEGFGIVYLEAGVHALPVVAGRAGGALDSVVDGVTGFLVDPREPIEVADAVSRLLTDPGLAKSMGKAASQRAREFAWPKIARRVEDLLVETAARGQREGDVESAPASSGDRPALLG